MKAAILLQGDPRFCAEFDLFLKNLKGFDQVDYFMYMWEDNPSTVDLLGNSGHQVVAPTWQHIDKNWALEKFKNLLPEHHKIVSLELADQNSVETFPITENFAQETRQQNVWKMWYSLYMANQARLQHEKEHGVEYDMVIRTRPDVALMNTIEAKVLKEHLNSDPRLVIIPRNKRCGYNGVFICDLFGIATPETMTAYCDLYNQALSHHKAGVKFHPETMLGMHLRYNNYKFEPAEFNIEFRYLGKWRDLSSNEEWDSKSVPGWGNKIYISDFGRWE